MPSVTACRVLLPEEFLLKCELLVFLKLWLKNMRGFIVKES